MGIRRDSACSNVRPAESCSSDDRARAATVIRIVPEIIHNPRSTGMRRRKKAVKHLPAGQPYRYRRGPKQASSGFGRRGQAWALPLIGKNLAMQVIVGRRGPTVGMTCDMRQLSFDARETPSPVSLTNPRPPPSDSTQNIFSVGHFSSHLVCASYVESQARLTEIAADGGIGAWTPGGSCVPRYFTCKSSGPPGGSHLSKNGPTGPSASQNALPLGDIISLETVDSHRQTSSQIKHPHPHFATAGPTQQRPAPLDSNCLNIFDHQPHGPFQTPRPCILMMIASSASPVGSEVFSLIALLIFSAITLLILRHYLPLRTTPAFVLVTVFFALWLPACIVLLVPIDLASSARTDDENTRGIWLPQRVLQTCWRIAYWLTFVLTWYGG